VLVASFGATAALWLDAASFLVSAALVAFFVPRPRAAEEAKPRARFLSELAEGMRFIAHQRLVRAVVLTVLVTNFLDASLPVLLTVFAREEFGSASDLGLMYGVFGAAALAGALAYSAIGHRLPRRRTFVLCFSVLPAVYLTIATLPSLGVTLVVLAAAGFAAGPINPLLFTVQSEIVPAHLRGRVFGAIRAGAWASIPLGILLGGVAIATIGVAATVLVIGICYAAVVTYGFFNPAFHEMDRAPSRPAEERASV
jgi:MFS family permease